MSDENSSRVHNQPNDNAQQNATQISQSSPPHPQSENTPSSSSTPETTPTSTLTSTSTDHADLLSKARAFLHSPQLVHEDLLAKRAFLLDKGLHPSDVDTLLRELVSLLLSSVISPNTFLCTLIRWSIGP